ncbi:MAG: TIGR00730 family Rossman fold protein [Eubacterium sp.]|nr:TIGR00730 family Rossman fold protein [Eubacterium sp.]MBR1531008.1 TIGR00730 family Rossman fold protein [Eubacterium sp.]MBR2278327.1 TIGR00730 family Rossman fold protein [Eubacterium sp.]
MNICVFGAASVTIDKKYTDAVEEMGEHLAKRGYNLVYGSGSTGNMGAAARGFKKGGGKTHGVIPNFFKEDLNEFVDFNCDKMTFTESMRERKAVMEREADAFIITPGGIGTFEEFFEVLTLKQLGRHRKPIVIYNINGYYDNMIAAMEHSIGEGFIRPTCNTLYKVFNDLDGMIEYIENDDMNGMTLHDFK